jgi:hypothetical protein
MWINVIDYRGDNTVINSRGDSLFDYRTKYFHKQQEDFYLWKSAGHKFRCFTQHTNRNNLIDDYWAYDEVVSIPTSTAAQARNRVLDYYTQGEWIGIWDNDASLYFDKLSSRDFVKELNQICQQAQLQNISSFVPFNAQQSPYPKKVKPNWTFKPKLEQKGTMLYVMVDSWRFDENMTALEDLEFACGLALQGKKTAMCEQVSLKELVNGKSTIFKVNAYHQKYKKPGSKSNPKGLLQWDAQLDRKEKYSEFMTYITDKFNMTIDDIKKIHKGNWLTF